MKKLPYIIFLIELAAFIQKLLEIRRFIRKDSTDTNYLTRKKNI